MNHFRKKEMELIEKNIQYIENAGIPRNERKKYSSLMHLKKMLLHDNLSIDNYYKYNTVRHDAGLGNIKISLFRAFIGANFIKEKEIEYINKRINAIDEITRRYVSNERVHPAYKDEYDALLRMKEILNSSTGMTESDIEEYRYLRNSLIPGMLDSIIKNLRYYDNFKLFEVAEVFSKNDEESDGEKEVLPIQKKYLTGAVVGKDPKDIFIDVKGVLENISSYTHMEEFRFREEEKEKWADPKGFLNIYVRNEKVGKLGLVSLKTMTDLGIKKINIALFELQMDKFIPYPSRTNKYKKLPEYPLVQKDLSVIVDEKISWDKIVKTIKSSVKEIEFVDEYKGSPIEKGKKSVTFRYKIGGDKTLTSEEIANVTKEIMDKLNKKCKAFIREE